MKKSLYLPLMTGLLLSCACTTLAQDKDQERERRQAERNKEREERMRVKYKEKYPEEFKDHISKAFTLGKSTGGILAIYNVDGFIKVEGTDGDKISIEIDRTVSARDKQWLEMARTEIKLGFEQIGDSVVAYLLEPVDTRPHDWHDRGNWNNNRDIGYNCNLQYTVKVPRNINLRVSTVNNGDVEVKDVTGTLDVGNVNGAILVSNARGATKAHTINGDLTVSFASNPPSASSFNTLNGKLTAIFKPDLSADLQFKSMNGAFFTDFENTELLPAVVTRNEQKRGEGTVYKLRKDTHLRVGSGGKDLKFETLNGNIYIKKQS